MRTDKIHWYLNNICHKAISSAILGQLRGENSMLMKEIGRVSSSYAVYGQVNEPLFKHSCILGNGYSLSLLKLLQSLVKLFYVLTVSQSESSCRTLIKSSYEWGSLSTDGGNNRNSGLPERRNSWGNGGIVVISNKTSFVSKFALMKMKGSRNFCTKASMPSGIDRLEQLIINNRREHLFINDKLVDLLKDPEFLMYAYADIKSKPGNSTRGVDLETLDGINLEWFNKTALDLGSGRFSFKPVRQVSIAKANGVNRILSVASPRDKIVQNAIKIILEAIFEPTFSDNSHGFRPGRSCHTALRQVKLMFGGTIWFLEGDIKKCFDSIDPKMLINKVSLKIKDQVFLDLLYKAIKVGYVNVEGNFGVPKAGTPQGSIISPILCNIYLNELDKWFSDLMIKFNKGNKRKQNPLYTKLIRGNKDKNRKDRELVLNKLYKNHIRPLKGDDTDFRRLRYVRYADDFIVSIIGSKKEAEQIKDQLSLFLKNALKLDLSLDKSKITHAVKDRAFFLGTEIFMTKDNKRPVRRIIRNGEKRLVKIFPRIQMNAPISKIINKLHSKGYVRENLSPTRVGKFIHYDIPLILSNYKALLRGLLNYYVFASNFTRFKARVLYILKYSFVLTIASKLKLRTKKQVFKKFGPKLEFKLADGSIIKFDDDWFFQIKRGFNMSNYDPESVIDLVSKKVWQIKYFLNSPCFLCKSTDKVEIHHVRHLKRVNKKLDFLTAIMVKINRKQLPLCKKCHLRVHKGLYDGPRL